MNMQSATSIVKVTKLCSGFGLVSPSLIRMYKTSDFLIKGWYWVSERHLKVNNVKHCTWRYTTTDNKHDIIFKQTGTVGTVSCEKLAIVCTSIVRPHNNIIQRNQHHLVTYSLKMNKSLLMIGYQTPWLRCGWLLIKLANEKNSICASEV